MRAKTKYKEHATKLRRLGLSYSEIKSHIPVAKSTLSIWLSDIELNPKQKKRIENLNTAGQKAGAKARHKQKVAIYNNLVIDVGVELPKLVSDEFFTMGLALYWAEGTKQKPWNPSQQVSFGNTDQVLILLMRKWLQKYGHINEADLYYRLHIHESANIPKARNEWARILNVNATSFRITIKKHEVTSRHVNQDYKGLISLSVRKSTWLNRRIVLWQQGVASEFLKSF